MHTTHHVASAHSTVLSWGVSQSKMGGTNFCPGQKGYPSSVLVGEYPSPVLVGGTLVLSWLEGYPYPGQGYPYPGVPPKTGVPSTWDWGTPHLGLGYAPRKDLGPEIWERTWDWGSPPGCEWTDTCESITFPILWMWAVIKS